MSSNFRVGTGDPPLRMLLFGIGLLLGGLIFGGGWWVLNGSALGGLILAIGVIVGPLVIAFGYA